MRYWSEVLSKTETDIERLIMKEKYIGTNSEMYTETDKERA